MYRLVQYSSSHAEYFLHTMTSERGRPRTFDVNEALDRALAVFWQHGFQGASLAQLTAAMEVSKPSLYAAFGNKEQLYLKVLDRYVQQQIAHQSSILNAEPDCRYAIENYLRSAVVMLTNPLIPNGCLIVNGTTDCSVSITPASIEAALRNALLGSEQRMADRIRRAQQEGQFATQLDAENVAGFFSALLAGLAVLAKSGAAQHKLDAIVTTSMATWPA